MPSCGTLAMSMRPPWMSRISLTILMPSPLQDLSASRKTSEAAKHDPADAGEIVIQRPRGSEHRLFGHQTHQLPADGRYCLPGNQMGVTVSELKRMKELAAEKRRAHQPQTPASGVLRDEAQFTAANQAPAAAAAAPAAAGAEPVERDSGLDFMADALYGGRAFRTLVPRASQNRDPARITLRFAAPVTPATAVATNRYRSWLSSRRRHPRR